MLSTAQRINSSTAQRHLHRRPDSDTIHRRTKSEQTTWMPLLKSKTFRPCFANRVSALRCPRGRRNPILRRGPALRVWMIYLAGDSRGDRLRNWPVRLLQAVPVWCCQYWRNRRCAARWRLISTRPTALILLRGRRRVLCWSDCCGSAAGKAATSEGPGSGLSTRDQESASNEITAQRLNSSTAQRCNGSTAQPFTINPGGPSIWWPTLEDSGSWFLTWAGFLAGGSALGRVGLGCGCCI